MKTALRSDRQAVNNAFPTDEASDSRPPSFEEVPAVHQTVTPIITIRLGKIEGKVYVEMARFRVKNGRALTSKEAHRIVLKYTKSKQGGAGMLNTLQKKGALRREDDKHLDLDRDPVTEHVIVMVKSKVIWPEVKTQPTPPVAVPEEKHSPQAQPLRSELQQQEEQAENLLREALSSLVPPRVAGNQLGKIMSPMKLSRRGREVIISRLVKHEFLLIEEHRRGSCGHLYLLNIPPPPANTSLPSSSATEKHSSLVETSTVVDSGTASSGMTVQITAPLETIRSRRREIATRMEEIKAETTRLMEELTAEMTRLEKEEASLSAKESSLLDVLSDARKLDLRLQAVLKANAD